MMPETYVETLDAGHCPDCNHRGFVLGPRGGAGVTLECGNLDCRARFVVVQGRFDHHIVLATRVPREREGGTRWR